MAGGGEGRGRGQKFIYMGSFLFPDITLMVNPIASVKMSLLTPQIAPFGGFLNKIPPNSINFNQF